MLTIVIPAQEAFDNVKQEFVTLGKPQTLKLEHSLISISKWESIWKRPFFSKEPMTDEQFRSYVKCMTVNSGVEPMAYYFLPEKAIKAIYDYMNDPRTGTRFHSKRKEQPRPANKDISSEEIYSRMVIHGIPFDPCEKWHINRLFVLIKAVAIQTDQSNRMSREEAGKWQSAMNKARRLKH